MKTLREVIKELQEFGEERKLMDAPVVYFFNGTVCGYNGYSTMYVTNDEFVFDPKTHKTIKIEGPIVVL